MRVNQIFMLFAVSLVGLSGCLGFGDDGGASDDECPTEDHHEDGNATEEHEHAECPTENTNSTNGNNGNVTGNVSELPNELPVANLNMTSGDGAMVNNTTAVLVGTNITFSAEGSADADGTIDLIGLTVTDSNSTRTAQLFQDGSFVPATFSFDHEGTVNITLRVLDDRGEATILETATFVNRVQSRTDTIDGAMGTTAEGPTCDSPTSTPSNTLTGSATAKPFGFQVAAGAQWIEATLTAGGGEITICDPEGNPISGRSGDRVVSNEDATLESGIDYFVFVLSGSSAGDEYTVDIVVHHEPRPADA